MSMILCSSSALQEHTHEQTKFDLRCNQCKFVFCDQSTLEAHVKQHHSRRSFQCDKCERSFSRKNNLNRHVQGYHENPGSYICGICDKKFNRKDFLSRHMEMHNENRNSQCPECDKQFKTKSGLDSHIRVLHKNKRLYVCDDCGMRTKWHSAYLEHRKLHTGETRKHQKMKLKQESAKEISKE